ncbi:MAG: chemotaxis protein [Rhizobiales bacterium]|nr:chemotaxis protein [Hyphomicrobiales bacterium]
MAMNIGILVDGLVSGLLILTIGYCIALNRRLKMLRADEATLKQTIGELIRAAARAENAISGLRAAAGETESALTDQTREANLLSQRLAEHVVAGEGIMTRLAAIVRVAEPETSIKTPTPVERVDATERVASLQARRAAGGRAA